MSRKQAFLDFLLQQLRDEGRAADDHQLNVIRFLPRTPLAKLSPVEPGSLVLVETRGIESWVLIVPSGGGLVFKYQEKPAQVLTVHSPLGQALFGRRVGDTVQLTADRVYRVLDHE